MATTLPPATDHLKNTLEEMRVSVAAEEARNKLAAALQKAILRLLSVLMTLLAEMRAGTLAAAAPGGKVETGAASETDSAAERAAVAGADRGRHPSPSRIGPRFCEQKWEPVTDPALALKARGNKSRNADVGAFGAGVAEVARSVAAGAGLPEERDRPCAPLRPPRCKILPAERAENRRDVRRAFPPHKAADSKIRVVAEGNTHVHFVTISN